MPAAEAIDRQSLTLPDWRSALKRRVRRRRKPPWQFWLEAGRAVLVACILYVQLIQDPISLWLVIAVAWLVASWEEAKWWWRVGAAPPRHLWFRRLDSAATLAGIVLLVTGH